MGDESFMWLCIFVQIIVTEASRIIQDAGRSSKPTTHFTEEEVMARMGSLTEGPAGFKSPSKSLKVAS